MAADMPFDEKALLHNKPALAGLGVAAAAGLYVLIKRKQTTGSTTSGAGTAGGQTQYTVPSSYPDTTGTDLVQQWGQFSQNLLSDLQNNFPGTSAPNGGSGGITTTMPTGTESPPAASPTPVGAGQAVSRTTITPGESLAPVLAFFGMSQQQFETLNPGIQSTYYNKPGTGAIGFSLPSDRIVYVAGGKGF